MEAAAASARALRIRGVTPGWAFAALSFLAVAFAVGVVAGPVDIGVGDVLRSLGEKLGIPGVTSPLDPTQESILWEIRVPRVMLAALVGGMLAVAGATYQGVFHNPLADPYLLGVAAGAGLGATLAIAYLPNALAGRQVLPFAAFAGAAVAVVLAYGIGRAAGRERDAATLVLAGVTVASFFTALQTFVQQQNTETLQEVYSWILGSLPNTGWSDVTALAPYVLVSCAIIVAMRRVVDVLSLGDLEAASLGVDVRRRGSCSSPWPRSAPRPRSRSAGSSHSSGSSSRTRSGSSSGRRTAGCCRCRSLVGAGFLSSPTWSPARRSRPRRCRSA